MKKKTAAKAQQLSPIYDETRKKWRLSVPAPMSDTGKRKRLFFDTKKAAEIEADRVKGMSRQWGTEGRSIKAALAEDAAKAMEILSGYNVTLTALAQDFIDKQAEIASSKTFAELWLAFEESRELKSADHKKTLEQIGKNLNPMIGTKIVCDITHDELRAAIKKKYKKPHRFNLALRSISPAFNMAVKEGWASVNPCKRIDKIDTGRKGAVAVLTLNQSRQVLAACKDYRDDETINKNYRVDASGALPAVAIMLFAGVRPTEATRLDWSDIDLEEGTILISNQKSKTDRSRYFNMPETLKEWLELTPSHERVGSVCPPNWKRKIQVIRQKTGITDARDQLRKTFASMHLAHFNDVNLTRSIIGHEQGDVLFTNYRAPVKAKHAAKFWQITPSANEMELEVVA